jgi:hypothetical protein
MAYAVPNTATLLPGRFLLTPIDADPTCCIGTVVLEPVKGRKSMQQFLDLDYEVLVGETLIHKHYHRVVFNRDAAQAITVDAVDYLVVYEQAILGVIAQEGD